MQTKIQIQVSPAIAADEQLLKNEVAQHLSISDPTPFKIKLLKRSIDARGRKIRINVTVLVAINEELPEELIELDYKDVSNSARVCHIIGAGPAGLFAALR